MANINVDRDTFQHALRNLTMNEVCQILQIHKVVYENCKKKFELEEHLLKLLDKGELSEEVYISIKGKAFSINKNFYDGFFYKFRQEHIKCTPNEFHNVLINYANNEKKYKFIINNEQLDKNYLFFSIERVTYRPIYDWDEERSRYFKDQLKADVEIHFNFGLVYIHSKNINENKIIKTFLNKVFNVKENLVADTEKIRMTEPKFDTNIAEKWMSELTGTSISGLSPFTIQMLDLLKEFEKTINNFGAISIKSIIFKQDVNDVEREDCAITEYQYGGENLQDHERIKKELLEGKKITGFKFEAEHIFIDEETEDKKLSILPITILYENNGTLRISISDENSSVIDIILDSAYTDVKKVFINKYISKDIINKHLILTYLDEFKQLGQEEKQQERQEEGWAIDV